MTTAVAVSPTAAPVASTTILRVFSFDMEAPSGIEMTVEEVAGVSTGS